MDDGIILSRPPPVPRSRDDQRRQIPQLPPAYHVSDRTPEATTPLQRLLADCERVLGPDHPDTMKARNNLAAAYQRAGCTSGAADLDQPGGVSGSS